MAYTTIDDPEAYFQVATYTGTSSGAKTVTFAGDTDMQADFIWFKQRSATRSHVQIDSVRGVSKAVQTDSTAGEHTNANYLASFDSDGFTTGSTQDNGTNTSGGTYVAWCWKAGTTSGITTNGDTDVTPSAYSFNQTSGFSIVKWSSAAGQTAHGLGKKPQFIFTKRLDATGSWKTYHEVVDATDFLKIGDTAAREDEATVWGDTEPDTVNFTVGSAFGSSDDYIGYCFTSIQGFSKVDGTYTGNGNADGPFVYTGFKPSFVMIKRIDSTGDWGIFDNKREGYNDETNRLKPNGTDAEEDDNFMDILSNGFKLRLTSSSINASGGTFIYAAFAEAPFVNSNGVPCNAR